MTIHEHDRCPLIAAGDSPYHLLWLIALMAGESPRAECIRWPAAWPETPKSWCRPPIETELATLVGEADVARSGQIPTTS